MATAKIKKEKLNNSSPLSLIHGYALSAFASKILDKKAELATDEHKVQSLKYLIKPILLCPYSHILLEKETISNIRCSTALLILLGKTT